MSSEICEFLTGILNAKVRPYLIYAPAVFMSDLYID